MVLENGGENVSTVSTQRGDYGGDGNCSQIYCNKLFVTSNEYIAGNGQIPERSDTSEYI